MRSLEDGFLVEPWKNDNIIKGLSSQLLVGFAHEHLFLTDQLDSVLMAAAESDSILTELKGATGWVDAVNASLLFVEVVQEELGTDLVLHDLAALVSAATVV